MTDTTQPPAETLATTCDGKEQPAFEAWAASQRFDMTEHPLHYLFLDARTDAARSGWKAGLVYATEIARTALTGSAGGDAIPGYAPDDISHLEGLASYLDGYARDKGRNGLPASKALFEEVAKRLREYDAIRIPKPPAGGNAGAAGEVERLARIRTSMALLQQNSEGCAQNHYGNDGEQFGMPGWLIDTKADLDAFTMIIEQREADRG